MRLTDCVDDLMDHDFREFKFFVFAIVADILCDNRGTGFALADAGASITIHTGVILILVIERADSGGLANTSVAHSASSVVLPTKVKGLEEKHYGHAAEGGEDEDDLNGALAWEELFFDGSRLQEHVDEHV